MLVKNVHTSNAKHTCIDINMQNPLSKSVFVVQRFRPKLYSEFYLEYV